MDGCVSHSVAPSVFFFKKKKKHETDEQVQCHMQCDVVSRCDTNLCLIKSLKEGFDVRDAVGTQSHTSLMDDLSITRMVALVTLSPPALCAVVIR